MSGLSDLPAQRFDAAGKAQVDYGAIWALAGPMMANSTIQAVLNLTDTWFVSRLSMTATAAMAAIYWVVLCAIILLGGIGMATQTFTAQAFGGRRLARASHAAWMGIYASIASIPLFVLISFTGKPLLHLLHLEPHIQELALEYWWPRLIVTGPLGLMVWSLTGFFNGANRARDTLLVTVVMGLANIPFNQFFIFNMKMGISGSAWGTAAAEILGLGVAFWIFLSPSIRTQFRSHLTWRHIDLSKQFSVGLPMGLSTTADLIGLSLFQLMLVSLSVTAGAATQIVIMLTSLAYMPGIGIALAGTTLVGQAIGANNRDWAHRIGNAIIRLVMGFMGIVGVVLALASPWILPLFIHADDPQGPAVLALANVLIWLAACYQLFDGLNLGSGFCLRGAGDVRIPAILVAVLSWVIWVPLTHMFIFEPNAGWVHGLPAFGFGAIGGWAVSVGYVVALGIGLWLRWASGAWRKLKL